MNELYHPEEKGEEVEAILNLMIIGCSVCLGPGVLSGIGMVIVTVVTRAWVCFEGGEPDSVEGLLELLGLLS